MLLHAELSRGEQTDGSTKALASREHQSRQRTSARHLMNLGRQDRLHLITVIESLRGGPSKNNGSLRVPASLVPGRLHVPRFPIHRARAAHKFSPRE